MTSNLNLLNLIVIFITFDLLHQDFDMIIISQLKICDKNINKIHHILKLKKAKNIIK